MTDTTQTAPPDGSAAPAPGSGTANPIDVYLHSLEQRIAAVEMAQATKAVQLTDLQGQIEALQKPVTLTPAAPAKGLPVLYRDAAGNESPAIITRVFDDGSVALTVFRDDAVPMGVIATRIDPAIEGGPVRGWFWPLRV